MPLASAHFLQRLCRVVATAADADAGDGALLQRFIETNGQAAFAALVKRHGALVWQACRRLAGNEQDAEDAFQATFLVLAQKAAKVRRQASLGSWLYGVAANIARSLRRGDERRRRREGQADDRDAEEPGHAAALRELQAILAEEVGRLPEKYREPFVLCCLEGQSKPEAARALGCREGTVSSRLARAKERLRKALARRGVDLSAALCVAGLTASAWACVPSRVLAATLRLVSQPASASASIALAAAAAQVGGGPSLFAKMLTAVAAVGLLVGVGWSYWSTKEPAIPPPEEKKLVVEKPPPRDLHGDPLPKGAVARLGIDRLRSLTGSLTFAADGKTLVGIDSGTIRTWDAATGKLSGVRTLPTEVKHTWARTARTGDGSTWLLRRDDNTVEVFDVPSGKPIDLPMPEKPNSLDIFEMSNDRRLFFFCETTKERIDPDPPPVVGGDSRLLPQHKQRLLLWNTSTKKLTVLIEGRLSLTTLAISADGKLLASSGSIGTHVWDVATGKALWHNPKFNAEEVKFTPDSQTLVIGEHGGPNSWHIVEATTGKPAKGYTPPDIGYVWTFEISPDGTKLAAPTAYDYVVCDLKTGKVTHSWPGANQSGIIVFDPDGRSVVLHGATLARYDLASGKAFYADVASHGHTHAVRRVAFTPDGRRVVSLGEDDTLRLWDPRDSKLLYTISVPRVNFDAWAITPDSKMLIAAVENLKLHRWSLTDGKPLPALELKEARSFDGRLHARQMHISADGQTVAISAWPQTAYYDLRKYTFSFWDLDSGRLLRWGQNPDNEFNGERSILAPDGRHAFYHYTLYATKFADVRSLVAKDNLYATALAVFSPDSRYVGGDLIAHKVAPGGTSSEPLYLGGHLWEIASGEQVCHLARDDASDYTTHSLVLSRDGRWLAQVDFQRFGIYDLRDGKLVLERRRTEGFRRRDGWISGGLAFSPDGRTAVTAHPDGNMLVWALPELKGEGPVSAREAEELWDKLKGDATAAYAAHWRLRDDAEQALRLFRAKLGPVKGPPEGELKELLKDLGSADFAARTKAMQQLRAHGRIAAPFLRAADKKSLPLETTRRIQTLLDEWAIPAGPTKEEMRQIRAVTIVERIGSAEARRYLEDLAAGALEARLTQEARESLQRLHRD